MSGVEESAHNEAVATIAAVAEAAGARLRAETEQDAGGMRSASESLMTAATSAMAAGYSLSEIAAAEARGQDELRNELRGDGLKRVERTGRQSRDAEAAHHSAIARARRLGLSTREIAHAAGVAHGTVRAISARLTTREPADTARGGQRDSETAEDEGSGHEDNG